MSQINRNRFRQQERKRTKKAKRMQSGGMYERDWDQEYQTQLARNEHKDRMERQKARRGVDQSARNNGGDDNNNGVADAREGKDIAHNKPLRSGGTNKDGYTIASRSKNRSNNGQRPKKTRTT